MVVVSVVRFDDFDEAIDEAIEEEPGQTDVQGRGVISACAIIVFLCVLLLYKRITSDFHVHTN